MECPSLNVIGQIGMTMPNNTQAQDTATGKRLAYNEILAEIQWLRMLVQGGVAIDAVKVLDVLDMKVRNLHGATDSAYEDET